ncbi:MAG: T9SS type A sorting domain-containing protein [Crocinitomicaceae bacterium]|nr:T9SS type A sorting domain-containing protein [Crocinitomicaceae bacterium]
MKKSINLLKPALLGIFGFPAVFGFAQHEVHPCHTNEKMDELKSSDPAIALDIEQSRTELEEWTANYIANEYSPHDRSAIYTIPVVFHVLHTNGPENISDAQIYDALQNINDDFNKLNTDWPLVNSAFLGIVADCQIEFVLARKKNNGACTNGITRTYTQTTHADLDDDQVDAVYAEHGNWPGNKYLNIFVVAEASGAAGYTQYPANWNATSMSNGIKILHNYVGSIGTSNDMKSTALTHEIGHWLNLAHCWGDSNEPGLPGNCSDDDGVADTPNTIGWTSCNVNGVSCSSLDNVENFMEYSYCCKMFTEGQKARMHAALESNTGDRDNLWTPANLAATGVSTPEVLCAVSFTADILEICPGESVTFTDQSYNLVTGHNWSFPGGTPSTSTSANPTITYNTPGVYNVSLQATDGSSTLTNTKTNYIVVIPDVGDPLPYSEGFENFTSFPDYDRFTIVNQDGEEEWDITSNASYGGDKCIWLKNSATVQTGTLDAFMSGPIDLSGVDTADDIVFNFRYSYRTKTAGTDEWLRFYISKDCGETWVLRKNIHGSALGDIPAAGSYFPPDQSAWYPMVSVTNINSDYYVSNFRFKFEFENDGGNNIFIDNINLYPQSMAELSEQELLSGISIYPNPVADIMNIQLSVPKTALYNVTILNTLGEIVSVVYNGELKAGDNLLAYSGATLSKGVYLVRITSEGTSYTTRFVKN